MNQDMNEIEEVFKKGSILDEACEQLSFRIDFYSKPNFYEAFMKLWDDLMKKCSLSKINFYVDKLNLIQQNIVNVDGVAEALNTTIENILDSKTYIFPSLFSKDGKDPGPEQEFTLYVNKYFIHIYVRNIKIENFVVGICRMMYQVMEILWRKNVVSISDIYLSLGAREILSRDVYLEREGFGGYSPLDSRELHNQFSTYQFIDDDVRCIVKNFLSLVNVYNNEDTEQMWEHNLTADCIYSFSGEENEESFNKLFKRMTDCCQNYIEYVCAR